MDKIYIQISSGRGPRECAYVVARLLDILQNEARKCGIACSLMDIEPSKGPQPEALLSATIELKGQSVQTFASRWLGTVQWVGNSPYRPTHRRKNWFVGVTLVDAPVLAEKLQGQVITRSMRSSGPGGQNVNKTNSAVRATHLETGISVTSRETRSQVQNQRMAREKLQEAFDQQQEDLVMERDERKWADHQLVERGNPVRAFHGAEFTER